ncbi:ABC transporter substrate-binding protein [Embleya scabrispora]|uniref:ABC transporter substrate-binding protein n=1 Tax=Embleya scabrispora TaxID=159449 RepID=UPI0003A4D166|nr:extracellular solute-binding protein [Embleya scabrispora]MYS87746.1 extracellular solute-binding protein [Streptomyces sp. SID5474]
MGRRRASTALAGIAAATMFMTACGSGSGKSDAGASGGEGTVRMLVNITPNLTQSFWKDLVRPFEAANPGIKVKIESPSSASVDTTLTTELAAGTEPDVVEGANIHPFAERLLDLSGQPWATSAPLADKLAVDGKTYAVPVGVQLQSLMFYNKDLFAKAGITAPPTTMDELTADMAKLKATGIKPVQTAGDWVTGAQISMIAAPTLLGRQPTWYTDVNSGKTSLTATMKPVLDLYNSWLGAGYLNKDALGVKYADGEAAFLDGKAAMYPMGSWFAAAATNPSFPIGVFPIPAIDGTGQAPMGVSPTANYAIFKSSKHQDAARKLVEYLTNNKDAVTTQLKQDGTFRTGFSYHGSELGDAVQGILQQVGTNVGPTGGGYGPDQLPAGYDTQFNKNVQGLYIGQSVPTVLSSLDKWLAAQPK